MRAPQQITITYPISFGDLEALKDDQAISDTAEQILIGLRRHYEADFYIEEVNARGNLIDIMCIAKGVV